MCDGVTSKSSKMSVEKNKKKSDDKNSEKARFEVVEEKMLPTEIGKLKAKVTKILAKNRESNGENFIKIKPIKHCKRRLHSNEHY